MDRKSDYTCAEAKIILSRLEDEILPFIHDLLST